MRSLARTLAVSLALLLPAAHAHAVGDVAVEVRNESEPVLCAEKDNVTIKAISPEVRRFQIEAAHPAYIAGLVRDNWDADWTACDMTGDPAFKAPTPPRRITFYESIEYWLVGYTFPTFWRPADTTFKVGDRVEKGLHLVQLWKLGKDKSYEVLVVYPQDGYWRARPIPPEHLGYSSYGSSFLFGPIEQDGARPVVNIKEIEFDPKTISFKLNFKDGTSGTLRLDDVDENRMVLDAVLDKPVTGGKAFLALRSMYVTEFNNDVARIAVREPGAKGWREEALMHYSGGKATDIWMGRTTHSRHNTSSPDMVFRNFSSDPNPPKKPETK
ncbi:hypothetical protein DWF00_15920 [Bosea caraganae]|uniref:Uncharacterized protein n=1 Tax=Bosea caraganae TaxID=2763117 RepID=A0A370L7E8_9HYPH|nr:hypothetical protein [Bosea caraganae]RDJ25541.1 hypothetical protein DWE98_11465 [Bosea caraganae]RDJ25979.1 hypothetical protein DWF00_15920 [Bosea caraganae]